MVKAKSAYSIPTKVGKLDTHIFVVWVDNESGVLARVGVHVCVCEGVCVCLCVFACACACVGVGVGGGANARKDVSLMYCG